MGFHLYWFLQVPEFVQEDPSSEQDRSPKILDPPTVVLVLKQHLMCNLQHLNASSTAYCHSPQVPNLKNKKKTTDTHQYKL